MDNSGMAVVEEQPVTVGGKTKAKKPSGGDFIMEVAHEVEGLTKSKALSEASKLATNIEENYFRLGGVLKLINDNSWFEGHASFDEMVFEQFGFKSRKAYFLMSIYDNLVTKQIPWDKVKHLGWTKLKDLAPVLTLDNVDEWVAKAENVTVLELQAMLKAGTQSTSGDTVKTKDELVKIKFSLKPDQSEVVQQALAKAKGELHTEYDSVALENICQGYVGGVFTGSNGYDLDSVIKTTGFEPLLQRIAELYPEFDIDVKPAAAVA